MTERLNEGTGRCLATAQLVIKPTRPAFELGAAPDVYATTLNAVHHANRHGDKADFIGVSFPMLRKVRGRLQTGDEAVLFGSEASLEALLKLEGLATLQRRQMVQTPDIFEAEVEPGELGAAYVRSRWAEKYTPGGIRRRKRRDQKRGINLPDSAYRPKPDRNELVLHYGQVPISVKQVITQMTEQPILVSTYGFSSSQALGVLPVDAQEVERDREAA